MIAERITAVPGSSRSFLGGAVVYSNELKTTLRRRPARADRAQHGAVSEEVAKALAEGIRLRTGATIGLGVTGIAGPTGGTETKPVGLVYIAVSDAQKNRVPRAQLPRRPRPQSANGPPNRPST